ncbi:hypothetical protein N752_28480 [Desulforamulus aquiferis]|nr:Ger(x)C family spore germination C-terminal domain-containing protein [Desulforamulus aquiferis]RYD01795.1 hypothetical protein N752_28480 [Desulforamulus aquiferis]
MEIKDGAEKVPMRSIVTIVRDSFEVHGNTTNIRVREAFNSLLDQGNFLVPIVGIRKPVQESKEARVKYHGSGAAVFKGEKMVDRVSPVEVRAFNFLNRDLKNPLLSFEFKGRQIAAELIGIHPSVKPQVNDEEVSIQVAVDCYAISVWLDKY